MAYNVVYKKSVGRDPKKFNKAEAKKVLDQLEKELSKNAHLFPALKGRFAGLREYRLGDYRVIYALMDKDVLVLRIRHRKDVYKKGI